MKLHNLHPKFYLILLGCFGSVGPVISASEIPRLYRSAEFLGRGDTGIAIADYDSAIFYNPAGLAQGNGIYKETILASPTLEISTPTRDAIRQISVEDDPTTDVLKRNIGKPQHIGIYNFSGVILRRVALGAFYSSSTNVFVAKSEAAGGLEFADANSVQNIGATFSIAEKILGDFLLVGATAKYIQRGQAAITVDVTDADQLDQLDSNDVLGVGTGFGGDIGLMIRGQARIKPSFGLTIQDLGDTKFTPTVVDDENPQKSAALKDIKQTVNAGFAIEPSSRASTFRLLLDVRDILRNNDESNSLFKRLHIGTELSVKDTVGFTGGLNQGYVSAGGYFDLWLIRIDLGIYTEEVGSWAGHRADNRFYFRLKAGF